MLKELVDMSDPQTAEALKYDIRWKVACGRALTETSFDPSTLVYWRRRIAESERPDRVFEAVDAVIAETGVLGGKRKRCVDSTVFDDAVATQDTVTQLVAAMRKVARLVRCSSSPAARMRWTRSAGCRSADLPDGCAHQTPGPARLFRRLAGPTVRCRHRLDALDRDRRSSTHTVASVRTTANEASAMRLAPVPPWKVSR